MKFTLKNKIFLILLSYLILSLTISCVKNAPVPERGRSYKTDLDTGEESASASVPLVINEIGINIGHDDNEFIELYNTSGTDVVLSPYRIYRATASGSISLLCDFSKASHFNGDALPGNVTVPAYGYYVIANDNNSGGVGAPDALIKDDRMVLSESNVIYLSVDTVSDQNDPDIIDFVGYGNAVSYEGSSPAPGIDDDKSIQRSGTANDSDNNGVDFILFDTPDPNTAPPTAPANVPYASNVYISGAWLISRALTGIYTYQDTNGSPEGPTTYQWLRYGSGDKSCTAGSTEVSTDLIYTPVSADENLDLEFNITPKSFFLPSDGTPVSVCIGPVTAVASSPAGYLLISEIQIGTTADGVDDEFIELYNPTGSDIDLDAGNYRIERASTSGGNPSKIIVFSDNSHFTGPYNTIVPAHGYFLIVNDNASAALQAMADALAIDSTRILLNSSNVIYIGTAAISGPTDPDIVDFVGYGTTGDYEGGCAAPEIETDRCIRRRAGGYDNNQNCYDFLEWATPVPNNSGL